MGIELLKSCLCEKNIYIETELMTEGEQKWIFINRESFSQQNLLDLIDQEPEFVASLSEQTQHKLSKALLAEPTKHELTEQDIEASKILSDDKIYLSIGEIIRTCELEPNLNSKDKKRCKSDLFEIQVHYTLISTSLVMTAEMTDEHIRQGSAKLNCEFRKINNDKHLLVHWADQDSEREIDLNAVIAGEVKMIVGIKPPLDSLVVTAIISGIDEGNVNIPGFKITPLPHKRIVMEWISPETEFEAAMAKLVA